MTFPRVKPLGWIDDELLTAAQATEMDLNISLLAGQVAARAVVQQATNWPERSRAASPGLPGAPCALAWAPNIDVGAVESPCWVALVETSVYASTDGQDFEVVTVLADGSATAPNVAYGELDGVPAFMTSSGSSAHFYTSIDVGIWTLRTTGPANHMNVAYFPAYNRWIAGHPGGTFYYCSGTTAGLSAWLSGTFTVSGGPGSFGSAVRRIIVMPNGGLAVAIPTASDNECATSGEGVDWFSRTLPFTAVWTGVAYSEAENVFMIVSSDPTACAKSVDGVTWTANVGTDYPGATDIAVYGSLWVITIPLGAGGGMAYSIDQGASWTKVAVGNHFIGTTGWDRLFVGDSRFLAIRTVVSDVEFALSARAATE